MSLYITTPTADGWIHRLCERGALECMTAFAGAVARDTGEDSWLPRERGELTARFLKSEFDHMLCVDSDIGWRAADAKALLATGLDVVSGSYVKREEGTPVIPAQLLDGGEQRGEVVECELVPAGFLLVSRKAALRMVEAYGAGSWCGDYTREAGHVTEDFGFCRRWRALGGRVWLHTGVRVAHVGSKVFTVPEVPS